MHELTDQEKDKFIDNLLYLEENGYKVVYRVPFRQKLANILHLAHLPKLKPIAVLGVAIVLIGLTVLGIKLQAIGRLDLLFRLLVHICILLLTASLLGLLVELLYIAFNACYNETNIHQEFLRYKLGKEKFRYLQYCDTELKDELILLNFAGQHRQIINELKHDQKFQDYAHKMYLFDQMNKKELSENSQTMINQTLKAFDKYMNHYQSKIEKLCIDPILDRTLMKIINDPKRKYYNILPKRIRSKVENSLIDNMDLERN